MLPGGPFDPLSRWQPDMLSDQAAGFVGCRDDGRNQHLIAEDVFVLAGVGLVGLRPVVVERTEESDAGVVGPARLSVEVWLHRITQLKCRTQDRRVRFRVCPDASFGVGILSGVRAQNRAEDAEL